MVLPSTFFTTKNTLVFLEALKVILVVDVNGLGAADKLSIDFSCEKTLMVKTKNKKISIFFQIKFVRVKKGFYICTRLAK